KDKQLGFLFQHFPLVDKWIYIGHKPKAEQIFAEPVHKSAALTARHGVHRLDLSRLHHYSKSLAGTNREHKAVYRARARIMTGSVRHLYSTVARQTGKAGNRRMENAAFRRYAEFRHVSQRMGEDYAMQYAPAIVALIFRTVEGRLEIRPGQRVERI